MTRTVSYPITAFFQRPSHRVVKYRGLISPLGPKVLPVLAMLFCLLSCTAGSRDANLHAEGWISDDAYRVRAVGDPVKGTAGVETRRARAREQAVVAARRLIVEKFTGIQFEATGSVLEFDGTRRAIRKEFGPTIDRGRVVKEEYGAGDRCVILYQVEEKDLRRRVMSFGPRR